MPRPAGHLTDVTPSEEQLRACCAAEDWLTRVQAGRPYADAEVLLDASDTAVQDLDDTGLDQALAAHARIGERADGGGREARWSRTEQAAALEGAQALTRRLADANRRYEQRFGHIFLIRATGRSTEEILEALQSRLHHDPATERQVVRRELADIVRLRLQRCLDGDGAR